MKTIKKELICLSFILLSCASTYAQENIDIDLTAEEYDAVTSYLRKEVELFTQYLSFIVDPQSSDAEREGYKMDALKLFIERGKKYYTYIYDENNTMIDSIEHRPVKMQTTSLRNPVPRETTMVKYLTNLVKSTNQSRHVTISIKSVDWHVMKIANIRKLEGDKYEVDVVSGQWNRGTDYRNREKKFYTKCSAQKRVVCRANIDDIVRTDAGIENFIVKLGDITAIETNKYDE